MELEWAHLPGFTRAEACHTAQGFVFVRDTVTRKLHKNGVDASGGRLYYLIDDTGKNLVLSEAEIRLLLGVGLPEEVITPEVSEVAVEEAEEEALEEGGPEDEYGALRAKIEEIRAAAEDGNVSQAELAQVLGVSKYKIRKALAD